MRTHNPNRLLGYPGDARLLIINADDFGMCHSINAAVLRAFEEGVVRSTTLMVPCPWAQHAMKLLRENPDLRFGVHLTVISEMPDLRWKPLLPAERVPSLIDESGCFRSYDRIPVYQAQARLEEVEAEFRAQIETVLAAGLTPTHLDWHCVADGGRDDIFEMSFALAREYGLALRVMLPPHAAAVHSRGLPCVEHGVLDSYRLDPADRLARYAQMLRELPPGLSEWAVHPGLDTAEMRAVEPPSYALRQLDFDFATSAQARAIIDAEGIIVLNYEPVQQVWKTTERF